MSYADAYRNIDFRAHPERYRVGKGEQGVLIAEPYKSEILPYWRFKTESVAKQSAIRIYELYASYKKAQDFVGMDMARKFLQMGFTRARRYANHKNGKKYDENKQILPQADDHANSKKAKAASVFKSYLDKVLSDTDYINERKRHSARYG